MCSGATPCSAVLVTYIVWLLFGAGLAVISEFRAPSNETAPYCKWKLSITATSMNHSSEGAGTLNTFC